MNTKLEPGDRIFCHGYRGPGSDYAYVPPGEYTVVNKLDSANCRAFNAVTAEIEKELAEEMFGVEAAILLRKEKRETIENIPDTLEQEIEKDAEEFSRPRSRYHRKL